ALVEDVAHVRPARVGEQRTVAERARSELHAALKPGDDLAVGDHVRGVAPRGFAAASGETGRLDRGEYLTPVERWTEKRRRVAARGRTFLFGAMHGQGGTDGGPRVVRRRGNEYLRERARLLDRLIGHAVERDAAGETQIVERCLAFEAPHQGE